MYVVWPNCLVIIHPFSSSLMPSLSISNKILYPLKKSWKSFFHPSFTFFYEPKFYILHLWYTSLDPSITTFFRVPSLYIFPSLVPKGMFVLKERKWWRGKERFSLVWNSPKGLRKERIYVGPMLETFPPTCGGKAWETQVLCLKCPKCPNFYFYFIHFTMSFFFI